MQNPVAIVTELTILLVSGKEPFGRSTERTGREERGMDKAREAKVSVVFKKLKDTKRVWEDGEL